MKKKFYTLQPARGQALLSFQNRRFPKAKMELFEVEKIEEVRATEKQSLKEKKQLCQNNSRELRTSINPRTKKTSIDPGKRG